MTCQKVCKQGRDDGMNNILVKLISTYIFSHFSWQACSKTESAPFMHAGISAVHEFQYLSCIYMYSRLQCSPF